MVDAPKYIRGRGLLRHARRLAPHEKGTPGVIDRVSKRIVPWETIGEICRNMYEAFDRAPEATKRYQREHGH